MACSCRCLSGKGYDAPQFASDAALFATATRKPVVLSCPNPETRARFEERGIVSFAHDEDAVAALGLLARAEGLRALALRLNAQPPHGTGPAQARPQDSRFLSEADSLDAIQEWGMPAVPWRLCRTPEDLAVAVRTLRGPLAVKACSADIPHKSEHGLVALGVGDYESARSHMEQMRAICAGMNAHCDGVIVASMVRAQRELMLGARWDAQFGAVVIVGDGGRYIEAMPDVATFVYPFDAHRVEQGLRRLRMAPLLDGVRGDAPLPLRPLAQLAVQLGAWLHARSGAVASVDINPVMATRDGQLFAADALVEIRHEISKVLATPAHPLP